MQIAMDSTDVYILLLVAEKYSDILITDIIQKELHTVQYTYSTVHIQYSAHTVQYTYSTVHIQHKCTCIVYLHKPV